MRLALELAAQGRLTVSPNPMVGCIIIKDGEIVGRGYHQRYGEAHAEINALRDAGAAASGATMYVTLEPCCHQGKTPPCTDAIIRAGIRRIIASHADPNPVVNGKGFAILRQQGITVEVGLLSAEALALNEAFIWHITHNQPFVLLKLASSLDGRIATSTGSSRWVTGEPAREHVHHIRQMVDAVVTGIGTVLTDDPQLNVRLTTGVTRQPARVVLDSRLRIPETARVLQDADPNQTILVTTSQADPAKLNRLTGRGIKIWQLPMDTQGRVDLIQFLQHCGRQTITSILVEGGHKLATSFLNQGLVNKLLYFVAPKFVGSDGLPPADSLGITEMKDALTFHEAHWESIGADMLFSGYLKQ